MSICAAAVELQTRFMTNFSMPLLWQKEEVLSGLCIDQ